MARVLVPGMETRLRRPKPLQTAYNRARRRTCPQTDLVPGTETRPRRTPRGLAECGQLAGKGAAADDPLRVFARAFAELTVGSDEDVRLAELCSLSGDPVVR
jgi:hypothetical protein